MEDYSLEDSLRALLRQHIEDNGIIAGHVADQIGIPRSAMSNFLKKRGQTFKLSTLNKICDAINLEVSVAIKERGTC